MIVFKLAKLAILFLYIQLFWPPDPVEHITVVFLTFACVENIRICWIYNICFNYLFNFISHIVTAEESCYCDQVLRQMVSSHDPFLAKAQSKPINVCIRLRKAQICQHSVPVSVVSECRTD